MPTVSLKERLAGGPLVFDGAMGTELYRRGQFVNNSLDGVNLRDPRLVLQIHREYVAAGADVIETNSFAANRDRLSRSGLDAQFEDINAAAVRLAREAAGDDAWVVGAVGPSGRAWDRADAAERERLVEVVIEHAELLIRHGVDGICFETFGYGHELVAVTRAMRQRTELPIFALAAFTMSGATADGIRGAEMAQLAVDAGADVIGANCADGPAELHATVQQMVGFGRPVAVLPNAGYPRFVEGRSIYMATPEYFGVNARRFFKLGVRIVGGCCGTTPDHVRSMKGAARMAGSADEPRIVIQPSPQRQADEPREPVATEHRSALARKVASGEGFVVSVEVNPPTGLDPAKQIAAARMLQRGGVDVINIADGPRASCRMSNWSLALQVKQQLGMESIVHFCARDRNLLGLQSDLLAYSVMGLNNVVIITGDPPKLGDYPHATAVFDLDSVGMLGMADGLNRGLDPTGKAIGGQTSFFLICGVEPAALDYDRELRRLEDKVRVGAQLIMTQPVYDPVVLDRFLDDTRELGVPVLVGLLPLASHRNAEFLHNEVPGMQIPSSIRERMATYGSGPEARAEGVRIAQEALLAVRDRVRGAYIMPPFGRYESALEILSCVGYPTLAELDGEG